MTKEDRQNYNAVYYAEHREAERTWRALQTYREGRRRSKNGKPFWIGVRTETSLAVNEMGYRVA